MWPNRADIRGIGPPRLGRDRKRMQMRDPLSVVLMSMLD